MSAHSLGVCCDVLSVDLLETLGEVAARYRQGHDPFNLLASAAVPYFVRQLDGLALFAQIPERFLPAGLVHPVESERDGVKAVRGGDDFSGPDPLRTSLSTRGGD
jgi:hypothetical protein